MQGFLGVMKDEPCELVRLLYCDDKRWCAGAACALSVHTACL